MRETVLKGELRDGARLALLKAGLDLFGEYGFLGATTRMIADEAQVNVSAIGYYFGGKKELYHSVMEYILSQMLAYSKRVQIDAQQVLDSDIAKDEGLKMMNRIIDSLVQLFVDSDEPRKWARIILREQANPTEAFDILYDGNIKKMQDMFAKIIAAYTGLQEGSDEVKIIAHTIYGQLVGFIVGRESILRSLKVTKIGAHHLDVIRAILKRNIEASLVFAKKEGDDT